jgi:hypothetical protein
MKHLNVEIKPKSTPTDEQIAAYEYEFSVQVMLLFDVRMIVM